MSESQPAASTGSTTADLGVVDPIRVPGADRAVRIWSRLSRLGQLFVVLAAVDIIVRALGLFRTNLFIEPTAPLTWLTAFLPHDALILLPAVVLFRRPTAATEFPLLVRGAIAVALVELLKDPARGLLAGAGDDFIPIVVVAVAAAIATGWGWAAMARGLEIVAPAPPREASAQLAIVVGGSLALVALGAGAGALIFGNLDLGDDVQNLLVRLTNTVSALSGLGLAYLGWVVVRGADDPARPATALLLGTVSVAALAFGTFLSLVAGAGDIWLVIFVIAFVGGYTGLVVAFGLGLADPSGTIEGAVPIDDLASESPEPA